MNGHMVAVEMGDRRTIYMVREPNVKDACHVVSQIHRNCHAYALAPVSEATLVHFGVPFKASWTFTSHHCGDILCCGGGMSDSPKH